VQLRASRPKKAFIEFRVSRSLETAKRTAKCQVIRSLSAVLRSWLACEPCRTVIPHSNAYKSRGVGDFVIRESPIALMLLRMGPHSPYVAFLAAIELRGSAEYYFLRRRTSHDIHSDTR
jgi:hypothetical protein